MSYQDTTIPCRDCGGAFTFTAGEQEFYAQKGFTNAPTRCPLGRRARKEGRALRDLAPGGVCLHDATGQGHIREDAGGQSSGPRAGWNGGERSYGAGRSYGERGGADRPRRDRSSYDGPLPSGAVSASVVRVDPNGRFLFVRVSDPAIDVFVHSSFFSRLPVTPREGDTVWVTVEPSERGPRAASFETE